MPAVVVNTSPISGSAVVQLDHLAVDELAHLFERVQVEAGVAVVADQRGDRLLQRRVAGALAEPGERDVHLLAAVAPRRDRVRRRQAEVVVAVELQLGAGLLRAAP